jgi:magnesium-transporting ATPase (P-type)
MAYKGGREIIQKVRSFMRIAEVPFEPERRMMAVACSGPSGVFTFVKGAPQVVLELCENRYLGGHPEGGTAPRDRRFDGAVLARNSAMASQSMRVLAMACAPGNLIDRIKIGASAGPTRAHIPGDGRNDGSASAGGGALSGPGEAGRDCYAHDHR